MDIHMLKLSSASDGHDHHMDMLMHHLDSSSSTFSINNPLTLTDHFSTAPPQPHFYNNNSSNVAYPSSSSFMNMNMNMSMNTNGNCNMASMREMIFRIAVMQPVHIDPESVKAPKRRNVKISKDPQSVAARHRRERISEKIRILQRLVPGGTKMDTASMLDEAIHYVKFLKKQVQSLEQLGGNNNNNNNNNNNVMAHHLFKGSSCQAPLSSHMLAGAMHQHVLRS